MKLKSAKQATSSTSLKKETVKKACLFIGCYLILQVAIQAYKLDWALSAQLLINTWQDSIFAIVAVPVVFFIQYKININRLSKQK